MKIEIKSCFERWRGNDKGFTRHVYRDKAGHVWVQRSDLQYVAMTSQHSDDDRGTVVKEFSKQ